MNNGVKEGFDGKPYCGSFKPKIKNDLPDGVDMGADWPGRDFNEECQALGEEFCQGEKSDPHQGCVWVKNASDELALKKKKEHQVLEDNSKHEEFNRDNFCKYLEGTDDPCKMVQSWGKDCMKEDWYKKKCT